MDITLRPIGVAKNAGGEHVGDWKDVVTALVIDQEFAAGLDGLERYSHLLVVYWMSEVRTCTLRHVPQGKVGEVPEVGIFACRCPGRPNPIGVSTVEILSVDGNVVSVKGLDAIADTPILDLKPYTPQYDAVSGATVPAWVYRLDY